jgi:hypothetical protein
VSGLPISPNTIVYYYIYGSVQAGLSRRQDNRCPQAFKAFDVVRQELDTNPKAYRDGRDIILRIIEEGEFICNSLAEEIALGGSPTPPAEGMSDIAATPTATLIPLTPNPETVP